MIFINFKTYRQSSGEKAVELAGVIAEVSQEAEVEIIACPQFVDLRDVLKVSKQEVWVQHVDFLERGRATGWLPAEVAKETGAAGTLLNHSEHKLSLDDLAKTLVKCKEVGLKTLVFANSVQEAVAASRLSPDFIGYEPPELIASPDTSVARVKPDVIEKVVGEAKEIPIIVGAGVKDGEDVRVSLKLGAKGVALSSGFVLAEDPKAVLLELAGEFQ